MRIHVVLVSDQILANLIPILMDAPDLVAMVVTPEMARRGADQRLRGQLSDRGIAERAFADAPDTDLGAIQRFARGVGAALQAEAADAEIVLNATGGTKLMALGFVAVFHGIAARMLYTDTANRRIELLPQPGGDVAAPLPMPQVLDVPGYLAAQGFAFRGARSDDAHWRERAERRQTAAAWLGRHAGNGSVQKFIGTLNWLGDHALERIPGSHEERLAQPRQRLPNVPRGPWRDAAAKLADAGVWRWRNGSKEVEFITAEDAQFVRGGWLEEYAWQVLRAAGAHDARLGVEGHWLPAAAITNEFDTLACHGNQLLLIECKTGRFDHRAAQGQEPNDNQLAYKLDSLSTDARGLFGQTWLLVAREPTPVLVQRTKLARIRLVTPAELGRLDDLARAWLA